MAAECPEDLIISDFAQGRLPAGDAAKVRAHVSICPSCSRRVAFAVPIPDTVRSVEPLPETVRSPGPPTRAAADAALERGDSIGRYLIVAQIGKGGMGVVYLAYDPALDRRVAIKVLHPSGSASGADEGRTRLLREAHAMAKLSQPNVVTIYDVGTLGEQVFLAMEFIEGQSLRDWLTREPRSWRAIVSIFLQAGRGLEAAHAAGMVHRDFKPDNVLIDARGRALVTDFGLACATEAQDPVAGVPTPDGHPTSVGIGLLDQALTERGWVIGTPGYMSPEQAMGLEIDGRADQYSFCVTLSAALFGGPREPIRDPALIAAAPNYVRQVVERGLSLKADNRFPNMGELLAALAHDPAARRRRVLAIAGAAVALALVAIGIAADALRRRSADVCYQPAARLAGIWDASTQAHMGRAALAAGAGSNTAWAHAEQVFERTASSWVDQYRGACEATRVQHRQPESALLLQLDCLDRQRLDLHAATELVRGAGTLTPAELVGMASGLPLPAECSAARALSVIEPPPPELREQINTLRVQLAKGRALMSAGQNAEALRTLAPLARSAHVLGYRPFEAETLEELGRDQANLGEEANALATEQQAFDLATAAHLDQLAAFAATRVISDLGRLHRPAAEIDGWAERARELVARVGPNGVAEYRYERALGWTESTLGRNASAVKHGQRALWLARNLFGDQGSQTLSMLNDIGAELEGIGAYDEMLVNFHQAIAVSQQLFGLQNDYVRLPWSNMAETLANLNRLDQAQEANAQAVAGQPPGTDNNLTTVSLAISARIRAGQGAFDEALLLARKASQSATRLHPSQEGDARLYVAEAEVLAGQPTLAIQEYEQIVPILKLEPQSPDWVQYLRIGGDAYLAAGRPKEALELLTRALPLTNAHPFYPGWVPEIRFRLAQALVATKGDRPSAAVLAGAAHDELVALADHKQLLAEIDAWRGKTFARR